MSFIANNGDMRISADLTDDSVLAELGQRLAARRIALRLSQAALAERAGLGKRTVERIEAGHSAQLTGWIRLLRALELLPALDALVPEESLSPLAALERQSRRPQRVRRSESKVDDTAADWTWGDQ